MNYFDLLLCFLVTSVFVCASVVYVIFVGQFIIQSLSNTTGSNCCLENNTT